MHTIVTKLTCTFHVPALQLGLVAEDPCFSIGTQGCSHMRTETRSMKSLTRMAMCRLLRSLVPSSPCSQGSCTLWSHPDTGCALGQWVVKMKRPQSPSHPASVQQESQWPEQRSLIPQTLAGSHPIAAMKVYFLLSCL